MKLYLRARYACISAAIASAAIIGCGQAEKYGSSRPIGALESRVIALENGQSFSECDRKNFEQMKQIAADVDSHASVIDEYIRSQNDEDSDYKAIPLGPVTLLEPLKTSARNPYWTERPYGWQRIIEGYRNTLGNPIPYNWDWLNGEVRGVLFDDEQRIFQAKSYAFGRGDRSRLAQAAQMTKKCVDDLGCGAPGFSTDDITWLGRDPWYAHAFLTLGASGRDESLLGKIYRAFEFDISFYSFTKNAAIRRERDFLILPLYAGEFSSVKEKISRYIESVWSSPKLSVRVEWRSQPDPATFSLVVGTDTGGRSSMIYEKKTIYFQSGLTAGSIAHETGHVLGFPDNYYDTWDEQNCIYKHQSVQTDVMSTSATGSATAEHWTTLEAQYPGP